jgi:acetyl-CoA C-acetyltransferase
MEEALIVSAVRTPIGTFGGTLRDIPATDLGALVVQEALKRAGLAPGQVDEVILGNILQAGLGLNPARVVLLKAGLPIEIPAYTINKACGSSLKAVALAAQAIMVGDAEIVVAGGMESMSQAPYLLRKARWGHRLGHGEVEDALLVDGLLCPTTFVHMGVTAENIARKYGIRRGQGRPSREDCSRRKSSRSPSPTRRVSRSASSGTSIRGPTQTWTNFRPSNRPSCPMEPSPLDTPPGSTMGLRRW